MGGGGLWGGGEWKVATVKGAGMFVVRTKYLRFHTTQ